MDQRFSWEAIQGLTEESIELWRDCASRPLGEGRCYSLQEQRERGEIYDEALQSVERELREVGQGRLAPRDAQQLLIARFAQFSAVALDLQNETIQMLTDEFLPVGVKLARWARAFDPALSMPEIIQACRNAWTACGLQPLLGTSITITPSILAYSLLYPYSDNYLDNSQLSADAKLAFSARFRRILEGEAIGSPNDREVILKTLVGLIESEYPRHSYPQVFDSLLAIHKAQEQSITQVTLGRWCEESHLLPISCAKGGSSVLADACLAHGWLDADEARFAFLWGVLLQLGDDLQDVRQDLLHGSNTIFSRATISGNHLDSLVVQLLNFSAEVSARMDRLPHGSRLFKELLKMSWRSLIIRAVADSYNYFSPGFLEEAERFSPFRFAFLRERQDRVASAGGLYATLFDAFLESDFSNACERNGFSLVNANAVICES